MLQQVVFGLALLASTFGPAAVEDDPAGAGVLIEQSYTDWLAATNAKDIDAWSSFLAPQAVFLPPGSPALETNEAVIDYYLELFRDPHFALDCVQTFVEVAESGDMAWARGTCEATFTDENGERANGSSKWTKVWVRLADGSWKCRLNTWNHNGSA